VNATPAHPSISLSYAICTTPRTGSNFLCEVLQATDVAGCPDEYFWSPPDGHERWTVDEYRQYVEQIKRQGTTWNGVFGVKLMWSELCEVLPRLAAMVSRDDASPPEILAAAFPNLHYVWLTRRDKVRQGVSFYRAIATERWRSTDTGSRADAEVSFDIQVIHALIQTSVADEESWRQFFQQHGIQPLAVEYEELEREPETVVRQILAFLGVDPPAQPFPRSWQHQRQADDLTEVWVSQYHALKGGPA
jgi:trehalose 2-sulfotransferase